ncbi:MAG: NUDIX hydrolase [Thermomicrobiales bacterium]
MPTVGVFAVITDETGRIICVHHDYGDRCWTLPGGGMEPHESPIDALEREVREETGYIVQAGRLIGIYSTPWKDDLVLAFAATILDRDPWEPNAEIAEVGFFPLDNLPEPFSSRALHRISEALSDTPGVVHVFASK